MTSVHDGTYQVITPAAMKDVFATWLTDSLDVRLKFHELKPSTAKSYRSMVETHFVQAFGDYRSDQLGAAVLTKWRKGMAEQVASEKLARKSFNNLLNLLHSILAWDAVTRRPGVALTATLVAASGVLCLDVLNTLRSRL